jgi:predicted AAA+ superfamily ATPase
LNSLSVFLPFSSSPFFENLNFNFFLLTFLLSRITDIFMELLQHILPAWSGNLSKRLIKTPKLYLNDTGLLSHLVGFEPDKVLSDELSWGRLLENFVIMELLKQASWSKFNLSLYHYRSASGQEVDFIVERSDGKLVAVEVKATAKITASDFNQINVFAEETGKRFLRGIVLYTGKEVIPFAKNLFAIPVETLW